MKIRYKVAPISANWMYRRNDIAHINKLCIIDSQNQNMEFNQYLAKFVTGNLTTSQLPEIAEIGLRQGLDTPSLRILAGLRKGETVHEIDHYFKMMLKELSIHLPEKRDAALIYADAIVDDIIEGEIDIIAGIGFIKLEALDCHDFYSESLHYCYDSIGFDKVYGLYVQYNDVEDGQINWHTEKTKYQLLEEIQTELLDELKKWQIELRTMHNIA